MVDVMCVVGSALILDSLTASKSVEVCRIRFESLLVSKSVGICRFPFYRCPSSLALRAAFWILMGRSLLIRDRELTSSSIFLGWMMSSLVVWKLQSVLPRMRLESSFTGICSSCANT
ncbi:hypothetical protein L195_g024910 [Trifolium pratense]|uniref:Uncharacterized protein n=1 Tax=Trifolium pratense TaxID=57577 RepID=A0A2K3NF11_TRIPR|nr:hypothetical protein L195_g024910 [Trifolium pratense]